MNETYVEWMVKKKTPTYMSFLKILTIMLTVGFGFLTFVILGMIGFIITIALGVLAYFVSQNCDVEYEYLYIDKELTIDKIMAKTRRKKVAVFELEKMEIVAPVKSWHLDGFQHRTDKVVDYSSGEEMQPDKRFVFYYNGNQKVIFEPNEAMIKAMQFSAPRKVFKD